MFDTDSTAPDAPKLHKFERGEVIATRVAITRAGDGLSQALAIDPEELRIDQTVFVVLECAVKRVAFEGVKDAPGKLQRIHTLVAGTSTLVPKELVAEYLEAQRTKIEEAQGREALDFVGDEGGDSEPTEGAGD